MNAATNFGDFDADGLPDHADNCVALANPDQVDDDSDAVGNGCDNCPSTPNSSQENLVHPDTLTGDHCEDPEPDGVMDFIDNCPDAANPSQQNLDADGAGDACDPDDDNDGVGDGDEPPCGSDPLDITPPLSRPERIDGAFAGVDDDGDGSTDEPLPPGAEPFDCDGDGFTGSVEAYVFSSTPDDTSRDQTPCAATSSAGDEDPDAWPTDNNDDQRTTLADILAYIPVFGTTGPGLPYNARFDLNADNKVGLQDILMFIPFFNVTCTP